MQAHDAVAVAKKYLIDIFRDEIITDVGLEEVVLDRPTGQWKITLGFFRNWDAKDDREGVLSPVREGVLSPGKGVLSSGFTNLARELAMKRRAFKVLSVDDKTGEVLRIIP